MKPILASVALWALAPGAWAQERVIAAHYGCERGAQVEAVYVNTSEPSLAILAVEGQQVVLMQAPSASGARYVQSVEGQLGYQWWSRGAEARLDWIGPDGSENSILSECQSESPDAP